MRFIGFFLGVAGISGGNAIVANHIAESKVAEHQIQAQATANILAGQIQDLNNRITWDHLVEATRQVTPSTVQITTAEGGIGSGVIITGKDGKRRIITNAHVIEGSNQENPTFRIRLYNGSDTKDAIEFDARIMVLPNGKQAVSPSNKYDLAILEIPANIKLPASVQPISFRDFEANRLSVGEVVIAVGSPLGYSDSVTAGIISHLDRIFEIEPENKFMQHSAPINPGNSGGGLYTIRVVNGKMIVELVGINTVGVRGANNIGGAIHPEIVRQFLKSNNVL